MKFEALLTVPVVPDVFVTLILPVVAPAGTGAVTCVDETSVVGAVAPLNRTTLLALKPIPLIFTTLPVGPLDGENAVMLSVTVKFEPLVTVPWGVTTWTLPVLAPSGTTAFTCVLDTGLTVGDGRLLNRTTLAPFRFVPLIVTVVPVRPLAGVNDEIVGVSPVTVKVCGLVTVPLTPLLLVTVTLPVIAVDGTVAFSVVAETKVLLAATPLNLTALPELKPVPVMVTEVPRGPLAGERLAMRKVTV